MSISTKTGDRGKTGLWSGERTWKDDNRVEAYGTIDELNSFMGEAKHSVETELIFERIEEVQNDLFRVAGQLASKSQQFVEPINTNDVEKLTNWVAEYEGQVDLSGFVIPGSTISSAKLDICRTVARRAERRMITVSRAEDIPEELIKYVNRLSDLLYIMGRFEEKNKGKIQPKEWNH